MFRSLIDWKDLKTLLRELPTHARGDGMDFGSQLLLYLYIKLIIAYIQLLVAMQRNAFITTFHFPFSILSPFINRKLHSIIVPMKQSNSLIFIVR